jgi:hypothetical protein
MDIDYSFTEGRWVSCSCGYGGDQELDIVGYYETEISEWVCPECEGVNEYRNNTMWDRADEYIDMMKEG